MIGMQKRKSPANSSSKNVASKSSIVVTNSTSSQIVADNCLQQSGSSAKRKRTKTIANSKINSNNQNHKMLAFEQMDTTIAGTKQQATVAGNDESVWIFGLMNNIEQLLTTFNAINQNSSANQQQQQQQQQLAAKSYSNSSGTITPSSYSSTSSSSCSSQASSPAQPSQSGSLMTSSTLVCNSRQQNNQQQTAQIPRSSLSRQIKFHEYKGPPSSKRQQLPANAPTTLTTTTISTSSKTKQSSSNTNNSPTIQLGLESQSGSIHQQEAATISASSSSSSMNILNINSFNNNNNKPAREQQTNELPFVEQNQLDLKGANNNRHNIGANLGSSSLKLSSLGNFQSNVRHQQHQLATHNDIVHHNQQQQNSQLSQQQQHQASTIETLVTSRPQLLGQTKQQPSSNSAPSYAYFDSPTTYCKTQQPTQPILSNGPHSLAWIQSTPFLDSSNQQHFPQASSQSSSSSSSQASSYQPFDSSNATTRTGGLKLNAQQQIHLSTTRQSEPLFGGSSSINTNQCTSFNLLSTTTTNDGHKLAASNQQAFKQQQQPLCNNFSLQNANLTANNYSNNHPASVERMDSGMMISNEQLLSYHHDNNNLSWPSISLDEGDSLANTVLNSVSSSQMKSSEEDNQSEEEEDEEDSVSVDRIQPSIGQSFCQGFDELLFSEYIDLQDVPMNVEESDWLKKFLPPCSMN